jgi:N-acetylneuraminic acid mutarotase
VINGKIYIIGGLTYEPSLKALNVNEEYDPATDMWTTKAPMPNAKWGMAVSEVDRIIYVIGGQSGGHSWSSLVHAYDPKTNSWTAKAYMPTGRTHVPACSVNGIIYVIGGATIPDVIFSTVEAYDPATNTWAEKADMPTPRHAHNLVVVEGKIYAIGGAGTGWPPNDILATVEEYDPTIDLN